jgi:hypothetical protein
VDQVLASTLKTQFADVARPPAVVEPVSVPMQDDGIDSIRAALSSLGVADDVVDVLINEARVLTPSADPLLLMAAITERLAKRPPVQVRKPQARKPPKASATPEQDLRHVVSLGKQAGQSGYEALLAAGFVKPPLRDLAA